MLVLAFRLLFRCLWSPTAHQLLCSFCCLSDVGSGICYKLTLFKTKTKLKKRSRKHTYVLHVSLYYRLLLLLVTWWVDWRRWRQQRLTFWLVVTLVIWYFNIKWLWVTKFEWDPLDILRFHRLKCAQLKFLQSGNSQGTRACCVWFSSVKQHGSPWASFLKVYDFLFGVNFITCQL